MKQFGMKGEPVTNLAKELLNSVGYHLLKCLL